MLWLATYLKPAQIMLWVVAHWRRSSCGTAWCLQIKGNTGHVQESVIIATNFALPENRWTDQAEECTLLAPSREAQFRTPDTANSRPSGIYHHVDRLNSPYVLEGHVISIFKVEARRRQEERNACAIKTWKFLWFCYRVTASTQLCRAQCTAGSDDYIHRCFPWGSNWIFKAGHIVFNSHSHFLNLLKLQSRDLEISARRAIPEQARRYLDIHL
jgi:hypothetical protein